MLETPSHTRYVTVEEFMQFPATANREELVRGEVRVNPPPFTAHGVVNMNVSGILRNYVREHRLGMCFADGTGFQLPNLEHTVRGPDAAFVAADRLPPEGIGPGYLRIAPDLVVETLSPSDTAWEIDEKVDDYLSSGTRVVWLIDPRTRRVTIVSADGPVRWVREGDTLDGGNVLPGFACAVSALFEGLAPQR